MYQVYLHPLRVVHLAGAVQTQYTLLLLSWTRGLFLQHYTMLQPAVALPMPISNLSNCRCTSISCMKCKKQKKVNQSGHTKDASDAVAGASQEHFKLMVSTSESDPYISFSSKDLVSDVGLSKGSESMSGEW